MHANTYIYMHIGAVEGETIAIMPYAYIYICTRIHMSMHTYICMQIMYIRA